MPILKTHTKKTKVLIVEDSPTAGMYLEHLLSADQDIEVIGNLRNGKLAVDFVKKIKPDIITMDIDMPVMNGYDATRRIMAETPVPIIIVTASRNAKDQNTSMNALSAGALTVIEKPGYIHREPETEQSKRLVSLVKIHAQVKVIRRRFSLKQTPIKNKIAKVFNGKLPPATDLQNKKYLAIGISTGGPEVLKNIFDNISPDFKLPVLVVQHITDGFLDGMVSWLNASSNLKIKIASNREIALPGHVYFAPNRFQMGIKGGKIHLQENNAGIRICPSVEYLFGTLAKEDPTKTIAMLLTGMGSDGAKELKLLRDAGALTIAQDEQSSLVFGMPNKAIQLNGAGFILNPDKIIQLINNIESGK